MAYLGTGRRPKTFWGIKKYWVTIMWSQGGILNTDGQRLALSERMMEVGHSELGLETKRKSKIPVRVFNSILRVLSIREFGIWKLYRTAAFWLSDFKSLNDNTLLVLFSPLVWRYNTGFVYKRIPDFVLALNHRYGCFGMLWF